MSNLVKIKKSKYVYLINISQIVAITKNLSSGKIRLRMSAEISPSTKTLEITESDYKRIIRKAKSQ